jgi:hypothetical protein
MSLCERHLLGMATTASTTRTHVLLTLPALPEGGSFTLQGSVIARALGGGRQRARRAGRVRRGVPDHPPREQQTTFYPVHSGTMVAGVFSQSAGGAGAAPCTTSPTDGGVAQGFAPPGCSTLRNGRGMTMPLTVTGALAALSVVGIEDMAITWAWDLTLLVVSP